jgi:hypothetical protein
MLFIFYKKERKKERKNICSTQPSSNEKLGYFVCYLGSLGYHLFILYIRKKKKEEKKDTFISTT